jgi:predicted metal-dependent enzyme (double-stranded beta helix superfamily)
MNLLMQNFINDVREIVNEGGGEEVITAKVAEKLEPLMSDPNLLPENLKQPKETGYAVYPVYVAKDDSFSIASVVWGAGKGTGIHDHGTWGVIGIFQGAEREERFMRDQDIPLDQPANIKELGDRIAPTGDVFVCCTSDKDIHRVSCATEETTVGIHIYGGNIGTIIRHSFDKETGIANDFVTPWDIDTPLYA